MGWWKSIKKTVGGAMEGACGAAITLATGLDSAVDSLIATGYYGNSPSKAKPAWMAQIPDERKLTEIFVPGTHETMALHGSVAAQCNTWTLQEQLMSGCRILDIRAKHEGDDLPIYHGIMPQYADFKGVVATVKTFLKQNPSEVIFMFIRKEGDEGKHSRDFDAEIRATFSDPSMWLSPQSWGKLGEARGKILLLHKGSHLRIPQQPVDQQNEWDCANSDQKAKFFMDHATKARVPDALYWGQASCVGFEDGWCYMSPQQLASHVNKVAYEGVGKIRPGAYMFDFPGQGLIDQIIARNPMGHLGDVKEMFRKYDKDGNGVMTKPEFMTVAREIMPDISVDGLQTLFSACDLNGDGTVEYDEFIDWVIDGQPVKSRMISIRAGSGRYCTADEVSGQLLINQSAIGRKESFYLIQNASGSVSIKTAHQKFLSAQEDGGVLCTSLTIGYAECFQLHRRSEYGMVALKDHKQRYLNLDASSGTMMANGTQINALSSFEIKYLKG
eukprot:TRINITY_DN15746_c0_g1_i1.p1 TRINITY_DN15746_c0_g1~~TRINITY_DN15746_c0_g1_i1.p1  ORF type:complete len:500 (+),score=89.13 TRINITY_DN15746_c0_g1_i1:110-1609(+)